MARFPREEISYKRLYKHIDLDKELGIEWPHIDTNTPATIKGPLPSAEINADISSSISSSYMFDHLDEMFCRNHGIEKQFFTNIFEDLEKSFNQYLFNKLDKIQPLANEQPCDVCGGLPEEDNAIAICNGCGIPVHHECYGIKEPLDRFWFCAKCLFYYRAGNCCFCNNKNGILKITDDNRWAHVVCTLLNPHLSFSNKSYKEPVDTSDFKKRQGICNQCHKESQTLVKCSYFGCKALYHTCCAAENLYTDISNKHIYCPKHDFNLPRLSVISKRKLLKYRNHYPSLENDLFIRKCMVFSVPKYTEFREIVETQPIPFSNKLKNDDLTHISIVEYWKAKRCAYGTYFTNMFLFIDYLNQRNTFT